MNSLIIELLKACLGGAFAAGLVWGWLKSQIRSQEEDHKDLEKRFEDLERWQKEIAIPIMQTNVDSRVAANEALQRLDSRVSIIAKETWDELRRKLNREEFKDRHDELARQLRNIRDNNGD